MVPAVLQVKGNAICRDTAQGGAWACDPDENGAYTLNAADVDGVLCMTDTQPHAMVDGEQVRGVTDGYAVRRLTPRECERLQGFPDGWTRVPWRGKPAEECPDTPRYKALGNSMAVPVMRWIGERIQEVMDREETEE